MNHFRIWLRECLGFLFLFKNYEWISNIVKYWKQNSLWKYWQIIIWENSLESMVLTKISMEIYYNESNKIFLTNRFYNRMEEIPFNIEISHARRRCSSFTAHAIWWTTRVEKPILVISNFVIVYFDNGVTKCGH